MSPPCDTVAITPAIDWPPLPPRVGSALEALLHSRFTSSAPPPFAAGGRPPCRSRLTLKTLVPPLTWARVGRSEGSESVRPSRIRALAIAPVIPPLSIITSFDTKTPMNDHRLPGHFTRCPASSACRMIPTISPRVVGRNDLAAVKLRARAQLVKVFGAVWGVEPIGEEQIMC